jgi:predicted  nucleic acid-binding Zn-ribbon protein
MQNPKTDFYLVHLGREAWLTWIARADRLTICQMLDAIEKLLILQDRDRKIRRLNAELARIDPERKMFQFRASELQSALETCKARVKQLESDRKALELEVESKKELIARYSNQQLQTRKNDEYRALAHEIDTCNKEIHDIEDRELELMEQAEAAQKEVQRSTQGASEARTLMEEQLSKLSAREENLKKELSELQQNREELAGAVDESVRARYERLVRSKGENVVVGISHGVCGGCHMRVPPQLLVQCQAQQEVVTCSNCGRILYYTRDMNLAVAD